MLQGEAFGFVEVFRLDHAMLVARLNSQADGGAVLAVDHDVRKRRNAGDL